MIMEARCKWRHSHAAWHFILVMDQCSVASMLDNRKRSKVKNSKIQDWRLELASFCYTVKYRPGKDNGTRHINVSILGFNVYN